MVSINVLSCTRAVAARRSLAVEAAPIAGPAPEGADDPSPDSGERIDKQDDTKMTIACRSFVRAAPLREALRSDWQWLMCVPLPLPRSPPHDRPPTRRPSVAHAEKGRGAPDQSWHARCHRLPVDATLSRRVPVGQTGDRDAAGAVVAPAQSRHPQYAAAAERAGLRQDLGPGRERLAPEGDQPQPGGKAPGPARRPGRGRFRHAVRQSPAIAERLDGAEGSGMRAHPPVSALSAIFGADHRDRQRQGIRRPQGHALATGYPHRAALFRWRRLYRRARRQHRHRHSRPRLRARPRHHLVSRHAADRISRRATPITASASRRRAWCASASAGRRSG